MKTTGMDHQLEYLHRSEGKRNFALFAEMGTGKTWMTLADAERLFIGNKIDALLVWAPKGAHAVRSSARYPAITDTLCVCHTWDGQTATSSCQRPTARLYRPAHQFAEPTLRVLAVNYDMMLSEKGREVVDEFIRSFRVLAVSDESKKIANPAAKRTVYVNKSAREAEARRILSGKPLTKAPMDLFSQFDFLKKGLLGTDSYRAFVAEFAVLLDPRSPKMQGLIRKLGPAAATCYIVDDPDENGKKMYRIWRSCTGLSSRIRSACARLTS